MKNSSINQNEVFRLKKVCADCPFRKDRPFYGLTDDRIEEIRRALNNGETFHCHKTVDYDKLELEKDSGEDNPSGVVPQTQFCAGARATMMNGGTPNMLLEIGKLLGVKTDGFDAEAQPVYGSVDEWADAMLSLDDDVRKLINNRARRNCEEQDEG